MGEPVSQAAGSKRTKAKLRWGTPQWIAVVAAVAVIVVDQVTKHWALANVAEDVRRPFIGEIVTLQLVHNPGAAFSMGEGSTWLFTILSVVVLAVIAVALPRVGDTFTVILLGFLGGGAAGNLIDRCIQPPGFPLGHVVDFLNYRGLFVGNVADIFIVGAAVLLVIAQLIRRDPPADSSIDEGGRPAVAPDALVNEFEDGSPMPPSFPPEKRD